MSLSLQIRRPNQSTHFGHFLGALHRRFILLRILEGLGAGILIGCAIAAAALPVLKRQGVSLTSSALAIVGLAAVAGVARAWHHRPRLLQTAVLADRQLGLESLLATALLGGGPSRVQDGWLDTIAAIAEQRCASLTPAAVSLNRWGVRAWGGTALALGLVLTLALLLAAPANSRADEARRVLADAQRLDASTPAPPEFSSLAAARSDSVLPGRDNPDSPDHSRVGSSPISDPHGAAPPAASGSDGNRHDPQGGSTGSGGGTSHTDQATQHLPTGGESPNPGELPPAHAPGLPGGAGAGNATASNSGTDQSANQTVASPAHGGPVPEWQGDHWDNDVANARAAIAAGHVPPQYSDLVRGYFVR